MSVQLQGVCRELDCLYTLDVRERGERGENVHPAVCVYLKGEHMSHCQLQQYEEFGEKSGIGAESSTPHYDRWKNNFMRCIKADRQAGSNA